MIYPLEHQEQRDFVEYLNLKNIKHTSIPNATFCTSWKQKFKNKAEGLNPGLPDLLICLPDRLLFCEMKRVKGGVISSFQKSRLEALNKYDGVEAIVCFGCQNAIDEVEKRLKKK